MESHEGNVQEKTVLLEEMTWCEVQEVLRSPHPVALLPTGVTEAHGPHLPLNTDAIISLLASQRAAKELQRKGVAALVLPLLPYGVAYCASPFAGTVTLEGETLTLLVRDICLSAVDQGFKTVCLCSKHIEPAHLEALKKAGKFVQEKTGVMIGIPDMRDEEWAARLPEEFKKGSRHAGSVETSMVMVARPDLVREDVRNGLDSVWIDLPAKLKAGAKTFKEAGSDMAYFGNPAGASIGEGETFFHVFVDMIVTTVERLLGLR